MRRGDGPARRLGALYAAGLALAVVGCNDRPGDAGARDAKRDDVVELSDATDADDVADADDATKLGDVAELGDVTDAGDAGPHVVTVTTERPRLVAPWFLGLNGNYAQAPSWSDPAFGAALAALHPGTLRFPGGAASNYWDWLRSWFHVGFGPETAPSPAHLNTFGVAVSAASAVPVIVLNVLTWQGRLATAADDAAMLSSQYNMLTYVMLYRMPVQFVELGDGLDVDVPGPAGAPVNAYSTRFPSGADYARAVNPWIAMIHRRFLDAQVAVVGAATPTTSPRAATWNAGVFEAVRGADAVALHLELPVRDPAMAPSEVLALPFAAWRQLEAGVLSSARERSLDAWITESGLRDRTPDQAFASTWLQGLVAATLGLLYLSEPVVTRACFLDTVGAPDVAALFPRAEPIGDAGARATVLGTSAGGAVFSVFTRALAGARVARTLAFEGAPTLAGGADPALLGAVITGQDGRLHALLLNLTDRALMVDVGGAIQGAFSYEQTSATPSTRVTGAPGELTVARGEASGALTLAPWSLTRLYP